MVDEYRGTALVLRRDEIDTDQIVSAEHCKRITRDGYADVLFSQWRQDPDFALNQQDAAAAAVLIAGHNFGTGSSREHAVWALRDWGFSVVIASSFGDIFRRNAIRNGLVPVQLLPRPLSQLADLVDAKPGMSLRVSVIERKVRAGDLEWPFGLDDRSRRLLLDERDEITAAEASEPAIAAFEKARSCWLPDLAKPTKPCRTPTHAAARWGQTHKRMDINE
ncbi:3-isopropylmalate dehydratase small subunit [Mycobacterium sp. MUNTM1]